MTTTSWSSGSASTTDAEFRAWGSEFSAALAAVGMIQTADTGQINWATVVRGAANTYAGYEVWRFNDAMQATAPIFIRIAYGQGYSANDPRFSFQIGTGSNGAGVLTGIGSGVSYGWHVAFVGNPNPGSASAASSYMCHTNGFFGMRWKIGHGVEGACIICRTCDPDGTPNAIGAALWSYGTLAAYGTNNCAFFRYAGPTPAVVYSINNNNSVAALIAFSPGHSTALANTTLPSGDKQVVLCWGRFPDMQPLFGVCCVVPAEYAAHTTFQTAMVGAVPHTFINMGTAGGGVQHGLSSGQIAMLWE